MTTAHAASRPVGVGQAVEHHTVVEEERGGVAPTAACAKRIPFPLPPR